MNRSEWKKIRKIKRKELFEVLREIAKENEKLRQEIIKLEERLILNKNNAF